MSIFNSVSLVCDKYNVTFDIQTIIEKYLQKNLLMEGWNTMQSFDKNTQKIKKLDRYFNKCYSKDKQSLECYDTLHNLFLENPRKGFYKFINDLHGGRLLEKIDEFKFSLSRTWKVLDMFTGRFENNYNYIPLRGYIRGSVKLDANFSTIPELRKYIEENTDFCQKNNFKKSTKFSTKVPSRLKKPELIRIIIHGDPKGSIKN